MCVCVGCEQLAKRTGGECVASVAARLAKVSRNLGTPTHPEEPRWWLITFHRVMATDANRLNLSYFWARFVLLSAYLVWNA